METIKQRLLLFIEAEKITKAKFAQALGKSRAWITSMGDNLPSQYLTQIAERYPQLNINWLVTGVGSMYTDAPHEGFCIDDLTTQQVAEVVKDSLLEMFKNGEIVSGILHRQMIAELTAQVGELEAALQVTSEELARLQPQQQPAE